MPRRNRDDPALTGVARGLSNTRGIDICHVGEQLGDGARREGQVGQQWIRRAAGRANPVPLR
jgi:hypothetical protein